MNAIVKRDRCQTLSGGVVSKDVILSRVHPDDLSLVAGMLAAALAGQGRYSTQYRCVWRSGAELLIKACAGARSLQMAACACQARAAMSQS